MHIMKMTLKTLENSLNKHLEDTDTLAFGSCQYHLIAASYFWALKQLEQDRKRFEKLMGITYTGEYTLLETELLNWNIIKNSALDPIILELNNNILTLRNDEAVEEDYIMISDYLKQYDDYRMPIEDFYQFTKDLSWDLWSAALNPLKNFQIEHQPDVEQDNFEIVMGLAYTTFLYNTDYEAFTEFST